MFGFFKWKRATEVGSRYCALMIAGLDADYDKPIPNQVFGDAYTLGFFEQLIIHAVAETWRGKNPGYRFITAVLMAAYERLVPAFGKQIVLMLPPINQPLHPGHTAYKVGQREGQEYIAALVRNDEKGMTAGMRSFREFVVRNYLSGQYPA